MSIYWGSRGSDHLAPPKWEFTSTCGRKRSTNKRLGSCYEDLKLIGGNLGNFTISLMAFIEVPIQIYFSGPQTKTTTQLVEVTIIGTYSK